MGELPKVMKRIKVVLTSLLTYLIIAQTVLTVIVAEGALDAWPEVVEVIVVILGVVGAAILAIRRVTGVPPEERGLLPKGE